MRPQAQRCRWADRRRAEGIRLRAEPAFEGITTVRVAEVQARLERAGLRGLPRGYASNTLARLAGDGMVVRTGRGRFRINPVHPEILDLRFQMLEALKARWERAPGGESAEAEYAGGAVATRRPGDLPWLPPARRSDPERGRPHADGGSSP